MAGIHGGVAKPHTGQMAIQTSGTVCSWSDVVSSKEVSNSNFRLMERHSRSVRRVSRESAEGQQREDQKSRR